MRSEEVFDFSGGQLTQAKIQQLKESLTKDFSLIYQLIERVLEQSTRPSLVNVALETLNKYLGWIPLGFIFETKLIETLIYKFFPVPMFRNITLKCLTEIGSLSVGNVYDAHFARLYCVCIQALKAILPLETDIAAAYETGSQSAQDFIEDLSLFLTGFYRSHITVLESPELQPFLLEGHAYLAKISLVSDAEIFKICLEHWNALVRKKRVIPFFASLKYLLSRLESCITRPPSSTQPPPRPVGRSTRRLSLASVLS
jgi:exportin-1